MEDLNEYFKTTDEEILINEAYDHFMDAVEGLKNKDHKLKAYNLIANREYVEAFDFMWKNGIPDVIFVTKLAWGLRNFYEYQKRQTKENN